MLKYLLSTVCIFLFFEDVRLNTYKCANRDCSIPISKAKVDHNRPATDNREVYVKKGQFVDIHGVNTVEGKYLVKVEGYKGFRLLPKVLLKEEKNILQKAIYDVEDPFQLNQSPRITTTKQDQPSQIERFNSIVFNNSCLSEKNTDSVDQLLNVDNVVEKELTTDAAPLQKEETPVQNEILDNDTTKETNKPASSNLEANTHGTENVSESTQTDSAAEKQKQTKSNEIEEADDVIVEAVEEDLVDQENKSKVTTATNTEGASDPHSQSSSNPTSQNSVPTQSNPEPKVAFGDRPSTFSPSHTSNDSSVMNQTDDASLNQTDDVSLNQTDTSKNESNSVGSQTNTTKFGENENIVSKSDVSTSNGTQKKNIPQIDEKVLQINISDNASALLKDDIKVPIGPSNDTTGSVEKQTPSAESMVSNPVKQDKFENVTSPLKKEVKVSQETPQPPALPNFTSSNSSSKPSVPSIHKSPISSAPAEESGLSNKSAASDSYKIDQKKPSQETLLLPASADFTSSSSSSKSSESSSLETPTIPSADESVPLNKSAASESYKSDEEKPSPKLGQTTASPDPVFSFASSTDKPLKPVDHILPGSQAPKSESLNENAASDSDIRSSTESVAKNEPAIPETPSVDPLETKDEPELNLPGNQINFTPQPASVQSREDESAPTPPLVDSLSENTIDLSPDQKYDESEDSSQHLEDAIFKEESAFYTDVFGYIGNFSSLLENVAVLPSYLTFEWLQTQNDSVEQPHCDEESCSAFSIFDSMAKYGFDVSAINLQSWSLAELHQSKETSLVAGILLCIVLLFTTLISILRNSKKKSRISTLISVVNQLEKKLLVATKEISLLEEQLTDAPVTLISQPATEVDYESSELLQQQVELLQIRNTDLEDKVTYLEKELHNVTTSAFEMHKLLENSLSTQAQSRLAEDEVDTLRSLTERQDRQIDDLMKEMDAIVTENRYLKDDLKKMEKEFSSQTKKNLELSEKNRNLSLRLDQQIEETATMKSNYKSEIYQLQAKIEDLEINLRRSEFQVESLNRAFMDKHENKSDDQMQALQDDVQLKLQLSTLKAMNNELSAELKEQKNARRTLDDHIGDVIRKCNELTQALEVSEKGRSEAVNKLQVLTDYFNEKESQLQKEISAKEKLFMESENKDQLLSQKLSSLKEEIKNNKDRNEELKKEIEAQERSFKTQLATAEQKSRDLWFALRQAERKYQESEKEAATLRNKILILENNLSSANQKLNEKHSSNGDLNGQPLMFSPEMLSYRGPNDFIPPPPSPLASHSPEFFPPEPSYSPDERLPPLGGRRVPSPPSLIVPPPDDDDFKPPLPHAQYMPGRSRHDSLNMSSYYGDNAQYN